MGKNMAHRRSDLCYLDASRVTSPAGVLADLDVLSPNGEPFGRVAGVIIDTAARRACYFDVEASGWLRRKHYVLPADHVAQVEAEAKSLRLLVDPDREGVSGLDSESLREFSDDDLIRVLFTPRAA